MSSITPTPAANPGSTGRRNPALLGAAYRAGVASGLARGGWVGSLRGPGWAHSRPEFPNRVEGIILFHRRQKSEMVRIVEIQFSRLTKLLEERKITRTLDPAAREWLAVKGWDPAYGARPLKRVIQRSLQNPLAGMILEGAIREGDTVHVSTDNDGLTINGKLTEAA